MNYLLVAIKRWVVAREDTLDLKLTAFQREMEIQKPVLVFISCSWCFSENCAQFTKQKMAQTWHRMMRCCFIWIQSKCVLFWSKTSFLFKRLAIDWKHLGYVCALFECVIFQRYRLKSLKFEETVGANCIIRASPEDSNTRFNVTNIIFR